MSVVVDTVVVIDTKVEDVTVATVFVVLVMVDVTLVLVIVEAVVTVVVVPSAHIGVLKNKILLT